MIRLTTTLGDQTVSVETFDDLYALSIDLTETADEEYMRNVLTQLRDGERVVSVRNAAFIDVYEVI